jgi:hypothetical protein
VWATLIGLTEWAHPAGDFTAVILLAAHVGNDARELGGVCSGYASTWIGLD